MFTRESLIERMRSEDVQFLFFWGHTPKGTSVDASCLSQWFACAFEVEGVSYATAEHFMMAEKARLFGDREALARIVSVKTPAEAKAIGREVRGYDEAAWERARFHSVVRGNFAKFGQNAELRDYLVSTGHRILVEASPRDRIWGIGMGASNPDAHDPARWRGRNLLGFALMEAREKLRASS